MVERSKGRVLSSNQFETLVLMTEEKQGAQGMGKGSSA